MVSRRSRRGARRERGAVAVEAALVTPLLFALIFGIIEFGMLFKDWLAVSNAVRAGVRIASAEPRVSTFATDAAADVAREGSALTMVGLEELWVYNAKPDGTPVGGDDRFATCSECVRFTWSGEEFVVASDTWAASTHNSCQSDPDRMSVGVFMRYEHDSVTNWILDGFDISDHAVMSFEPIPLTRGCKP